MVQIVHEYCRSAAHISRSPAVALVGNPRTTNLDFFLRALEDRLPRSQCYLLVLTRRVNNAAQDALSHLSAVRVSYCSTR
jgi:hypothetical protein